MGKIKYELVLWLIVIIPFVLVIIYWDKFPDTMPLSYNMNGHANSYASKAVVLLIAPVINLIIYFILLFKIIFDTTSLDNLKTKRINYIIRLISHLIITILYICIR